MKIYTKTGDKGTTRLVDGSCVTKHHPRVDAYGTVDELNSYLGIIQSRFSQLQSIKLPQHTLQGYLWKIQNDLFVVGSLLATEKNEVMEKLPQLDETDILHIETAIDDMTDQLAPLTSFILPTGHELAAHLHYARTVCRRAERKTSELVEDAEAESHIVLKYLNRLSDFLFTAARYVNQHFNIQDVPWMKK